MHGNLQGVKAHLTQVERGTKLWEYYFLPRKKTKDKSKKLKRFGTYLYVAEDIGLMAYVQNDYKFMMFGKTTALPTCEAISMKSSSFKTVIRLRRNPWHGSALSIRRVFMSLFSL